jgi:anti-sigma regulatory factor (Ser/Thr protein kinase)
VNPTPHLPMTRSDRDATDLRHEALLYDAPEQFIESARRWIEEGLAWGHEVVVAAPGPGARALSERLGAAADDVVFLSAEAEFRGVGPAFRRFRARVEARDHASRPLRLVIHHPGVGHPDMAEAMLREYLHHDSLANTVIAGRAVGCLCPYPRASLSDEQIAAVEAAHPLLRRDGDVVASARHLPPAAVIAEGQRRVGDYVTPPSVARVAIAEVEDLARARDLVRATAEGGGWSTEEPRRIADFLVAVSEVATNALVHGGGGSAAAWIDGDRLVCDVRDHGPGVADPLAGYDLAPATAPGGRGLWLARQLSTLLEVGQGPRGTLVRLHLAA